MTSRAGEPAKKLARDERVPPLTEIPCPVPITSHEQSDVAVGQCCSEAISLGNLPRVD